MKSNVPNRLQTGCHTGRDWEGWLCSAIGVFSETIALKKANHFFSFFGHPSFPASICMRNLGKGEGHTECTTKILTRTQPLPPPIKRFSNDDSDRNENVQKTIAHYNFWYKKKFCTYSTLFGIFLCRPCTNMMWHFLKPKALKIDQFLTIRRSLVLIECNICLQFLALRSWDRSLRQRRAWWWSSSRSQTITALFLIFLVRASVVVVRVRP